MKIFKHDVSFTDTKRLEIQIVLEVVNDDRIVASYVKHPSSIKKRRKLDELKLVIINDVVASAMNSIKAQNFPILSQRQSKKDYSYYIMFQPIDDFGNKLIPIDLKFRITTHSSKSIPDDDTTAATVRIKSFILEGETFSNSVDLIHAIDNICKELKKGNISVLDAY